MLAGSGSRINHSGSTTLPFKGAGRRAAGLSLGQGLRAGQGQDLRGRNHQRLSEPDGLDVRAGHVLWGPSLCGPGGCDSPSRLEDGCRHPGAREGKQRRSWYLIVLSGMSKNGVRPN